MDSEYNPPGNKTDRPLLSRLWISSPGVLWLEQNHVYNMSALFSPPRPSTEEVWLSAVLFLGSSYLSHVTG